jgi:septal ring factor EnvC (AmiA/AmiB activator)
METTNNSNQTTKPKRNRKSNVTKKDAELGTLAQSVSKVWAKNPQISLIWITQADFDAQANSYASSLDDKSNSQKNRPQITNNLKSCNNAIDAGISKLKAYLDADAKDKAEAKANYAKFGVVLQGTSFKLPSDKDKRKQALKLVLDAIKEFGYDKKPFGTDYFTPLIAQYNTLVSEAADSDKNVSSIVGNKNKQKESAEFENIKPR